MNKNEALKQIEELKAKLAELEATVSEPEYKPEDLVGKLCYVWDSGNTGKRIRYVGNYLPEHRRPFIVADTVQWEYAEPVPEVELIKMTYRPKKESRYDWSKVPEKAKYMYTNANGDVLWSTSHMSYCIRKRIWETLSNRDYDQWRYVSQGNAPCEDWKESEEVRTE